MLTKIFIKVQFLKVFYIRLKQHVQWYCMNIINRGKNYQNEKNVRLFSVRKINTTAGVLLYSKEEGGVQ